MCEQRANEETEVARPVRMTGTVTKVIFGRGFAFIRGVEDHRERFVYNRDVIPLGAFDTLYEGRKVIFTPDDNGPKDKGNGLRAVEVELA